MKSFIKHDFISKSFNKIYRRNLHSPQISKFPKKIYLKSFLVGILAGGLGSLVGMGGGFIAVPILSNHFGLSQVISNGTSLFAVFSTSIGGSFSYLMRENFDFSKFKKELFNKKMGDIHFPSAIGISISSSLTVIIASKYSKSIKSNILKLYSGIFMISIAPLVLLRSNLLNSQRYIDESLKIGSNNEKSETMYFLPVLIGSISGLIAGMFGVGGGAITVPALCLFTNTDYQTALGTSLAGIQYLIGMIQKSKYSWVLFSPSNGSYFSFRRNYSSTSRNYEFTNWDSSQSWMSNR